MQALQRVTRLTKLHLLLPLCEFLALSVPCNGSALIGVESLSQKTRSGLLTVVLTHILRAVCDFDTCL